MRLLDLVGDHFPDEQRAAVGGFILADEYQLALEWMLDGLIELGLPLPDGAAELVLRAAKQCGVSDEIRAALEHFKINV